MASPIKVEKVLAEDCVKEEATSESSELGSGLIPESEIGKCEIVVEVENTFTPHPEYKIDYNYDFPFPKVTRLKLLVSVISFANQF